MSINKYFELLNICRQQQKAPQLHIGRSDCNSSFKYNLFDFIAILKLFKAFFNE